MSVYDEILRKIEDGELAAISTAGCRNEEEQTMGASRKFFQLKKAQQKKCKLLLLTEYAFDFNPFDPEDTSYSVRKKFRLSVSPTTMILNIKSHINEGGALAEGSKDLLLRKSGVAEWDTTTEGVTAEDRAVLKKWLVPITFTIPTVRILNPDFTGNSFPIAYRTDVQRDPITGEIVGKEPNCVLINKLQSDMWFESNNIQKSKIDSGELDMTEKEAREANSKRADKMITVKRIMPMNFLLAVEVPLTKTRMVDESQGIAGWSDDDLFKNIKTVSLNKKISNQIEGYKTGENSIFDVNTDFFEIEMVCHNEETPMELGLNTDFVLPGVKFDSSASYGHVCELVRKFRDTQSAELDTMFLASSRIKTLTPELDKELIDAVAPTMDIHDKYITKAILQRNATIVSLLFDEEGDMQIADAECGSDEIADGVMSEEDLKKQHEQINKDEVEGKENEFANILGATGEGFATILGGEAGFEEE